MNYTSDYDIPWADLISSETSDGAYVTSIVVENGITTIGNKAFGGATGVTSVTIGNSVERIGDYAFDGCVALTSLSLPSGVTQIGKASFRWCSALTQVTLPSSLVTIDESAFADSGLTSVTIPASTQNIAINSFFGCKSLSAIAVEEGNAAYTSVDGVLFSKDMTTLIHYPIGEKRKAFEIPEGVKTISSYAFEYCQNLESVIVPASVTDIGSCVFAYADSLKEVRFKGNAPAFGYAVFYDCTFTAYYPLGNATWTDTVKSRLDGTITWDYDMPEGMAGGTYGENVTWVFDENTGTLTLSGTGAVQGSSSGSSMPWYSYWEDITSVVVCDGITEIPSYVFEYLENVERITLPSTLTSLALNTFNDCGSLNYLILPNSLTAIKGTSNTGHPAFIRCESLTDVYFMGTTEQWLAIPEAEYVTSANSVMTMHFLQLHEDPATCVKTGVQSYYQFDDTSVYGDYYDLDWNVISEPKQLPIDPSNHVNTQEFAATEATDTEPAYTAGTYCNDCKTWIKGHFTTGTDYPAGESVTWRLEGTGILTISGTGAMADYADGEAPWLDVKDQIQSVEIGADVIHVGSYAFSGCTALTQITFEGAAPTIGQNAFASVTATAGYPVSEESWTEEVMQSYGGTITWEPYGVTAFGTCGESLTWMLTDEGTLIISGTGEMTNYSEGTAPWYTNRTKILRVNVRSGVTNIGSHAFYNCFKMTEAQLPDTLTSIGYYAFQGCNGLTAAALPNSLTSIERCAFQNCGSLAGINIPESVSTIPWYCFDGCTNLKQVTLPDTLTSIGQYAFQNCSSLSTINIPDGVTKISERTFSGCTNLKNITLPDSVTSIGGAAFYECSSLTELVIPEKVTSLENTAWKGLSFQTAWLRFTRVRSRTVLA